MLTSDAVKKMSKHINMYSQLDIDIIVQLIKIFDSRNNNDDDSSRKHVSNLYDRNDNSY